MANFKAHVAIATGISSGAAAMAASIGLIDAVDAPWLAFLGVIGGMLPDIDADNSSPVRLLFNGLAWMAVSGVLFVVKDKYVSYQLGLIATAIFLLVRYGMLALFNQFTSHRGVFHSLLAAVFFAFLMTCISFYFLEQDVLHAWLNGVFLAIGFIVHLLLDEIYSVDLSNARMKKSFGTALKLFSYNNIPASILLVLCTLALYWLAPSPMPLVTALNNVQWLNHIVQAGLFQY
jgi:membrane-bound metal-dependent hydrolase YbcI (DUF457 family)